MLRAREVKMPRCQRDLTLVSLEKDGGSIPQTMVSLRGGSSSREGNVYIGTRDDEALCDGGHAWEEEDARVVCRMLGYTGGRATYNSTFGPAEERYWRSYVSCGGYESSIMKCKQYTPRYCNNNEAAGVVCGEPGSGDVTGQLTGGGRLQLRDTSRPGRSEVGTWEQNSFCLASGYTLLTTGEAGGEERRWQEELVALACHHCRDQVVCHYSELLYKGYTSVGKVGGRISEDRSQLLLETDLNGDGWIDFDEFTSKVNGHISDAFATLDENSDGSINDDMTKLNKVKAFSYRLFERVLHHVGNFFDTNNDKALSMDDFGPHIASRNIILSDLVGRPLITLPGPVYLLYSTIDKNLDEKFSLSEMSDFLRQTFDLIDTDLDCHIDGVEVVAALNTCGLPVIKQLAAKLLVHQHLTIGGFLLNTFSERADVNGDGRVTLNEIFTFKDFNFLDESAILVDTLLSPNPGLVDQITDGTGAIWLNCLEVLMDQPAFRDDGPQRCSAGDN